VSGEWEAVQVAQPCYLCKGKMEEGDVVTTFRIPIPVRYGKQRKKLKADDHLTFAVHAWCADAVKEAKE
jgi:hypothetical protein